MESGINFSESESFRPDLQRQNRILHLPEPCMCRQARRSHAGKTSTGAGEARRCEARPGDAGRNRYTNPRWTGQPSRTPAGRCQPKREPAYSPRLHASGPTAWRLPGCGPRPKASTRSAGGQDWERRPKSVRLRTAARQPVPQGYKLRQSRNDACFFRFAHMSNEQGPDYAKKIIAGFANTMQGKAGRKKRKARFRCPEKRQRPILSEDFPCREA